MYVHVERRRGLAKKTPNLASMANLGYKCSVKTMTIPRVVVTIKLPLVRLLSRNL